MNGSQSSLDFEGTFPAASRVYSILLLVVGNRCELQQTLRARPGSQAGPAVCIDYKQTCTIKQRANVYQVPVTSQTAANTRQYTAAAAAVHITGCHVPCTGSRIPGVVYSGQGKPALLSGALSSQRAANDTGPLEEFDSYCCKYSYLYIYIYSHAVRVREYARTDASTVCTSMVQARTHRP